jgi:TetR/AcrR family transcriptional repressor of nem operon
MGRPIEFDHDAVIDAALNVFWTRGVHRSSIDDLVAASGLARSSLYNSFGGKQALYEQAIQRYVDEQSKVFSEILSQESLKCALEDLIHAVVADNFAGRGCVLVNGASGLIPGEAADQQLLQKAFSRMFATLERRIRDAIKSGELKRQVDASPTAMMVCATLSGLRVFHKAGFPKRKMEKAAKLAFESLYNQLQ